MDVSKISRNSCRLCLSEGDFNVSLFGNYARRTNMIKKILVCLEVDIDCGDLFPTICYKCVGNLESYYDFITVIERNQTRLKFKENERHVGLLEESFTRRRYVREEVVDADYLDNVEERKEKSSSSLVSAAYMSPPNVTAKNETDVCNTPRRFNQECEPEVKSNEKVSQNINYSSVREFETQSQEEAPQGSDWKLTPDDNIIKRVKLVVKQRVPIQQVELNV